MKTFTYPAETWNKEKCEKMAKRVATDGMGTKYSFKGYIGSSASRPTAYGTERYNGGTVIADEWYEATHRPFPILAEGFEIVVVPTWGWRIIKK